MKRGYLLMNTGSPDSPSVPDVKRYLGQFLMDPYVIDLPWPARALLVHGIILNTRPKKSAEAYQSIWTENGSPLIHCNALTESHSELASTSRLNSLWRMATPLFRQRSIACSIKALRKYVYSPSFRSMRWPRLARVSAGYKSS